MKFEIYREESSGLPVRVPGDWRWRIRANNGRILANSGEGYKSAVKMTATLNALFWIGQGLELAAGLRRAGLDKQGRKLSRERR